MKMIDVNQAKTHLPHLLSEVEAGAEVVITRDGNPVARLVAYERKGKRRFGALAGRIAVDDRFFDPLPDAELSAWQR